MNETGNIMCEKYWDLEREPESWIIFDIKLEKHGILRYAGRQMRHGIKLREM